MLILGFISARRLRRKQMIKKIDLKSSVRSELIDITGEVKSAIISSGIKDGVCHLSSLHTTAGLTINESADPSVKRDILAHLEKNVPHCGDYHHMEGNSDSHIKTSLMGSSEMVIIDDGQAILGRWQAIYFCEFDGPRHRTVVLKILGK